MTDLFGFLTRNKIFILVILAVMALVYINLQIDFGPQTKSQQISSWESIIPGKTTEEELKSELGAPLGSSSGGKLNFNSTSPVRKHEVVIENGIVVFAKEIVTQDNNITVENFIAKYGSPDFTLYGPASSSGEYLYVYPNQGIAFLGSIRPSIIIEVLHFQPTNINDFINTWATGYSSDPEEELFAE